MYACVLWQAGQRQTVIGCASPVLLQVALELCAIAKHPVARQWQMIAPEVATVAWSSSCWLALLRKPMLPCACLSHLFGTDMRYM